MSRQIILAAIVALLMNMAQAQEAGSSDVQALYVTDQLRLSLYEQADSQSKVIELLNSGDRLIVEEIAGPYAKVLSPSGNRGWVKRGFLVSDRTSNLLLAEMTEINEQLESELAKLNNSKIVLDQYEKDMDALSVKVKSLEQQKQQAEQTVVALELEAKEKEMQRLAEAESAENQQPLSLGAVLEFAQKFWLHIGLAFFVVILIGYIIGRKLTEASVKRKFHGIKVW